MTKAMTARTDVNLFMIDNFLARAKASPGSLEQYRRLLERIEVWLGKPLEAATTTDLGRLKADHLTTISSGYDYADLLKMFYRRMKPRREDLEDLKEILTMDRKKLRIARKDLLGEKCDLAQAGRCQQQVHHQHTASIPATNVARGICIPRDTRR
jgi:hypothetical protein